MTTTIGFIGLGMMGRPMVENLASRDGLAVIAFDRAPAALEALTSLPSYGNALSTSTRLEDLAGCDVVITMLPNSAITSRVIEGADDEPGLVRILRRGSTIIDMGSSDPTETIRLAPVLAAAGIGFVDAPSPARSPRRVRERWRSWPAPTRRLSRASSLSSRGWARH